MSLFLTSVTSLLFTFIFISRHRPPHYSGPIKSLSLSASTHCHSGLQIQVPGSETLKSCFLDICVKQDTKFYCLVSCTCMHLAWLHQNILSLHSQLELYDQILRPTCDIYRYPKYILRSHRCHGLLEGWIKSEEMLHLSLDPIGGFGLVVRTSWYSTCSYMQPYSTEYMFWNIYTLGMIQMMPTHRSPSLPTKRPGRWLWVEWRADGSERVTCLLIGWYCRMVGLTELAEPFSSAG